VGKFFNWFNLSPRVAKTILLVLLPLQGVNLGLSLATSDYAACIIPVIWIAVSWLILMQDDSAKLAATRSVPLNLRTPTGNNLPREAVDALQRGDIIRAIFFYRRDNPAVGLREAKDFIEDVQRRVRAAS
jgi:hypothetical protein